MKIPFLRSESKIQINKINEPGDTPKPTALSSTIWNWNNSEI